MPEFSDGMAETQLPGGSNVTTDVVVVGSGPAGAGAALCLSTLGMPNIMITKYRWTANTPRAHITNQRAMEIFRDLGHRGPGAGGRDAARAGRRHRVLHVDRGRGDRPDPDLGHASRAARPTTSSPRRA